MSDGHHFILDAGTGLHALGRSMAALPPLDIGVRILPLLLTHRHSDHVFGLAQFVSLVAGSYRVRVACGDVPRDVLEPFVRAQISEPLFPSIDGLADAVEVRDFDDTNSFYVSAACHVRALAANHPGGASVLRVDDAAGAVLAYAPDNELAYDDRDPTVVVWRTVLRESLQDIPLLLHDATYVQEELPAHRGWGHSSAEEATRFAMEGNAGTLLLIHHHPDRDDDAIDAIVARCRAMVAAAGSSLQVAAAADGLAHIID
jgi:phosphoribosyl 1,2-cyclic phosphodiesterase